MGARPGQGLPVPAVADLVTALDGFPPSCPRTAGHMP